MHGYQKDSAPFTYLDIY